jgi:hypothetical protein
MQTMRLVQTLGLFQAREKILRRSCLHRAPLQRRYACLLCPNVIFALGEVLVRHRNLARKPLLTGGSMPGQSTKSGLSVGHHAATSGTVDVVDLPSATPS